MGHDKNIEDMVSKRELNEALSELNKQTQRSQALMVLLELLLQTGNLGAIEKAAKNTGLPDQDIFELCAASSYEVVRKAVALHADAHANVLEKLARDEDDAVRLAVASNINASQKTMVWLIKHNDDNDVLLAAARNESMPARGLRFLSKNDDYDVRLAVASNEKIPFLLGLKLAKDDDDDVREAILKASFSWMWFKGFLFRRTVIFGAGIHWCGVWVMGKMRNR